MRGAHDRRIRFLTLYAFSVNNWSRPKEEVDALMRICTEFSEGEREDLVRRGIKVTIVGEIDDVPTRTRRAMERLVGDTASGTPKTLALALNYGGRRDMVNAMRALAVRARAGLVIPEEIDEGSLRSFLTTSELPDPDLIIRTGGEKRLSDFLLFESAYAELFFTETFWPDFSEATLDEALGVYARRQRRVREDRAGRWRRRAADSLPGPCPGRSREREPVGFTRSAEPLLRLTLGRTIYDRKRCGFPVLCKRWRVRVVVMNEMPSRDDQAAPTLRSADLWQAARIRFRAAPEIAVVEAVRPVSSGWPPPPAAPPSSLLSEVAREVAATLFDMALGAARGRTCGGAEPAPRHPRVCSRPMPPAAEPAKEPFPSTFYFANAIELFERLAHYGMYVGLSLYLTSVVGFDDVGSGVWLGNFRLVGSLSPIVCGSIADRITFKRSLIVAFCLYATGYLGLFAYPSTTLAPFSLMLMAVGGGFMKPVITGTVVRTAPAGRQTEGFSIFYRMINAGSVIGKPLAYLSRTLLGLRYVMLNSVVASLIALGIAVFGYREPEKGAAKPTPLSETLKGYGTALRNLRFTVFLVIFAGFYFMAEQFYMTFPKYVTRVIDPNAKFEFITLINPLLIATFQGVVAPSATPPPSSPVGSMLAGMLIASPSSMLAMGVLPQPPGGRASPPAPSSRWRR